MSEFAPIAEEVAPVVGEVIPGITDALASGADEAGAAAKSLWRRIGGGIFNNKFAPTRITPGFKDMSGWKQLLNVGSRGLGLGLGVAGLGYVRSLGQGMFGDKSTPAIDYSKLQGLIGSTTDTANAAIDAATKRKLAILQQYAGGGGVPRPADVSAQYNRLSGMSNAMGAATLDQMRKLAEANVGRATGIRAGGEAGAQKIKDVYANAAQEIMNASRQAGTAGSALTPVSGQLAALPAQIAQSGGTLGDYLKANQLVSAQDAGFLSQLAGAQGDAYAQNIARQDTAFRLADQARRQAAYQQALASAGSAGKNAIAQLLLNAEDLKLKNTLAGDTNGGFDPSLIDEKALKTEWKGIAKDKGKAAMWKLAGVTDPTSYAAYMYKKAKTASAATGQ